MRILFVVETNSPHSAKWINQLKDKGWEIYIFQGIMEKTTISPEYKLSHFYLPFPLKSQFNINQKYLFPFKNDEVCQLITRIFTYFFPNYYANFLVRAINEIKPDIIHSLGLNVNWHNHCLTVLKAKKIMGKSFNTPWIYSTWGSDLDYYAKLSLKNYYEVSEIIKQCDYLITECSRDHKLAVKMGFKGQFLGIFPAIGGFPLEQIKKYRQPGLTSARKIIILKGRDNNCKGGDPVGRAMTALRAFKICHDVLKKFEIYIFQASPNVIQAVKEINNKFNLNIKILPFVKYDDLLKIMGKSRIFISLTINDGLPISLVEAISLGAFPIHSNVESLKDWISNGKNGLLTPPEDPKAVAEALCFTLNNNSLIDKASRINAELVLNKLSSGVVKPKVVEMYQRIKNSTKIA